ncbi:MAG: hypothetical protein ACK5O7_04645 [Holosporales bacterium]
MVTGHAPELQAKDILRQHSVLHARHGWGIPVDGKKLPEDMRAIARAPQ